jgi:hypothetical protein
MRTAAIWIFGLLACGIFGGVVAELLGNGNGPIGIVGGMCAFACLRLWLGGAKPA